MHSLFDDKRWPTEIIQQAQKTIGRIAVWQRMLRVRFDSKEHFDIDMTFLRGALVQAIMKKGLISRLRSIDRELIQETKTHGRNSCAAMKEYLRIHKLLA